MQTLTFSIRKVRSGWFVCRFGDTEIWATDAWQHDGPRQFLKLLYECVSGSREEGFAVFDAEPGTYVLSIRGGEGAELSLWYSSMSHCDWFPEGVGDGCVLPELPRHLKLQEQVLHIGDLDLYSFACAVGDAFSAYIPKQMRDRYTGNWMPFPLGELIELRHLLGDYSDSLLKMIDRK